jgi:Polysaccharide deacetylase
MTMYKVSRLLTLHSATLFGCLCTVVVLLQGCGSTRPFAPLPTAAVAKPSPEPLLPAGIFGKDSRPSSVVSTPTIPSVGPAVVVVDASRTVITSQATNLRPPPPVPVPVVIPIGSRAVAQAATTSPGQSSSTTTVPSASSEPQVLVYASPTTTAYFSKVKVDSRVNLQVWTTFLRKYQIPFQVVTAVDKLEASSANVLILPSSVALSEREKQAIATLRARGVSVLASWLTGVRNENGGDAGYGFMEKTLDVKVMGTTEGEAKDNFMLPHGDNPVTHFLPAGTRIWLDRVKGFYPLRLQGRHAAADIMDWGRVPAFGKESSTIVFDERVQASGRASRSVVLGYTEQLWLSADPRQLEAVAHNSLMWLLRQPATYLAAWPHPYRSAFVMAVEMAGAVSDVDLAYAKLLEAAGGRATYYVVGENAAKNANRLNRLVTAGHEIAYLGDSYTDFTGHPEALQSRRLDTMRKMVKDSGVEIRPDAGFHAPMDSYDKITEKLLKAGRFGHLLTAVEASEARLPFFAPGQESVDPASGHKALIVLPRTVSGPEDSVDNCQPEVGLKQFFNELERAEKMAGLSVVSISAKSDLTDAQSAEIYAHLSARRERMWLATAGQVADWWRDRARVNARLESGGTGFRLVVSVLAGAAFKQAPVVTINLPEMGSTLRLVARGDPEKKQRVTQIDAWRSAVLLDGLAAGDYQWDVYFDSPATGPAK